MPRRRRVVYYVQPFWRDGLGRLAHGALRQFEETEEGEAWRAFERCRARQADVMLYSLEVEPDVAGVSEPRILARAGSLPPPEA